MEALPVDDNSSFQETEKLVSSYFLMESPIAVGLLVIVYLIFTLWLGPLIMAEKKPFELTKLLIGYNLMQILAAINFMLVAFQRPKTLSDYKKFFCTEPGSNEAMTAELIHLSYYYLILKIVDLFDTVFFVLRKKQKQITFLHLYHHAGMVISTFGYLKYIMDPSFAILQQLNNFVHLIMYTYYLIAALGPKYAKYIWWKKYMTVIQLVQFLIALVYIGSMWINGCKISNAMTYYTMFSLAILFALFGNFYIQAYKSPAKKEL